MANLANLAARDRDLEQLRQRILQLEQENAALRQPRAECSPVDGGACTGSRCTIEVSARHEVEEALRLANERYRLAASRGGVATWSFDLHTLLVETEQTVLSWLGLDPQRAPRTGEDWQRYHHPDEWPWIQKMLQEHLEGIRPEVCYEHRLLRADDTYHWVLSRCHLVRDETGQPRRLTGTIIDIHERKRVEQALSRSEERYRTVVEASIQGIAILQGGRIRYVNPSCAVIFGFDDPGELVGSDPLARVAPEHAALLLERFESCSRGAPPAPVDLWEGVRRDGQRVWIESGSTTLDWDGAPAVLFFLVDVTERKRLEAQFLQAQKMEAVGRLAGGVAHDFNNLLTVISGFSDLLLASIESDSPLRGPVAAILEASERAGSLTKQLLAFSRQSILAPKVLDLNAIVGDSEKLMRRLVGEDIELHCILAPRLGRVRADASLLGQVLLNLVVNARDAMPTGGELLIQTANVLLDADFVHDHEGAREGRYVMLSVRDCGCGMDEQTRVRIFEPFFTTKEPGKGTGLGLAMVYGILKQSGGYIEVESTPGGGSTFKVYLPLVEEDLVPVPVAPIIQTLPGGTETVLLVEDEDCVRSFAQIVLKSAGYEVLTAADGHEALEIVERHQGPLHLVVTDVVMPHVDGRQLAEALVRRFSDLKVLYLSGYTDDAVVRHGVYAAEVAFLQKPFLAATLTAKVREVLDRP